MSRNGSGTYNLPAGNPVVPSTTISSSWANSTLNDVAAALTQSISNDGQTVAVANLPMGGFRHTSVGAATATSQYARADQVLFNGLLLLVAVTMPTPNNYSGTMPLNVTTFADGQIAYIKVPTTNTDVATLTLNGAGPFPWVGPDGSVLAAGVLVAGIFYPIIWDDGTSSWRLLTSNPANAATTAYVDAQVATRLPLTGGTLTGSLTLAADPVTGLQAATRQWVLAQIGSGVAGVSSFNTRTGAVTLTSGDVTGALTFTPYNATNPSGYISGITDVMIVTALGYVPYRTTGGLITGTVTVNGVVVSNVYSTVAAGLSPSVGGLVLDFFTGSTQIIDLPIGGNNITAINNFLSGDELTLIFTHSNRSVTFPAAVKWPDPPATQPSFSAGALKFCKMKLTCLDSTHYLASEIVTY